MKQSQGFNFKLEGQNHSINAQLLSEIIIDLNTIISEIKSKLKVGNELELKVETFQKGSFDILFAWDFTKVKLFSFLKASLIIVH